MECIPSIVFRTLRIKAIREEAVETLKKPRAQESFPQAIEVCVKYSRNENIFKFQSEDITL